MTVPDSFPTPRIDSLIDSLGGSAVFSSLDAAQAYHNISVSPESQPITAFVCAFGTLNYKGFHNRYLDNSVPIDRHGNIFLASGKALRTYQIGVITPTPRVGTVLHFFELQLHFEFIEFRFSSTFLLLATFPRIMLSVCTHSPFAV